MARLGTAVGGGVTVMITCALLSIIYTPEQISELTGYNVTGILPVNNVDNPPQIIMDNGDASSYVQTDNVVSYTFDEDNPQQAAKPQGNRRKPVSPPINGTADYFQRTLAISKLFYTNEKLSYIRMAMEILSFLLVGAIWKFCFRKPSSTTEEQLKKEVADLKSQLEKLTKPASATEKLIAKSQVQEASNKIVGLVTTFEQKINSLDAKFAQCEKLFKILYQMLVFLLQNVEFKNKNINTNTNVIMLNAYIEGSKGSSSLDNELVDTSSSNILKSKNIPQESFSDASNTSVNTVSFNTSMDTSRNLSESSLLLSPIKKEPSTSFGMPDLIEENAGKTVPLPSTLKTESKDIQAVMEDPVVTMEVRATPWRPEMRPRRKKEQPEASTTQTPAAESTVPQNQSTETTPSSAQEEQQNLIKELQSKLTSVEGAKKMLEASLLQLQTQFDSLKTSSETERTALQGQYSEALKASNDLQTKLAGLQKEQLVNTDNVKNTVELLLKEKDVTSQLQKELEALKKVLEEQKLANSTLEEKFTEMQNQNQHLELQYNVAQAELSALQSQHATLESEHNTQCPERIRTLELVNEISKKENEQLQAALASSANAEDVQKLKAQLEDAEISVQMMEDKCEALQKELKESNNEITKFRLSTLGSVEQQERQYQDAHHQQQIISELLEKIQKLEDELLIARADAVDGVPRQDMETQTELDMDQIVVELQLAQAENEDKANYIAELEAHLDNMKMDQLKTALEEQLPDNLEEDANAVVESVNVSHEDVATETEPESVPESPASINTTPLGKTQEKKPAKKTVHDKLYQQAFEHHCPACDLVAQGQTPNVPHTNHSTPSPASRTRSLSASTGRKPPLSNGKTVSATNSFSNKKPPTKGSTSKTTTPASSRPSSPPRGRAPSRSLYPAPVHQPVPVPKANLEVVPNEDTPRIVPGAPVLEPYTRFRFEPASMNIRKSKKRSMSFTHKRTMPSDYQPTSPPQQ